MMNRNYLVKKASKQVVALKELVPDILEKKSYFYQPFHLTEQVAGISGGTPLQNHVEHIGKYFKDKTVTLYDHTYGCPSICNYCGFFTTSPPNPRNDLEKHIELKQQEMRLLSKEMNHSSVSGIYFGGGTPTILSKELLTKLVNSYKKYFQINSNAEITIEAHPRTINQSKLVTLAELGINRVSIGIQTLNNDLLGDCNRHYSRDIAIRKINETTSIFKNVNVDLMYGLKNQKIIDLIDTIEEVTDTNVNQITLYPLWLRPASKVEFDFLTENIIKYPSPQEMAVMYFSAKELLISKGFTEDFVGWFSKDKKVRTYEERWVKNVPCLGFGAGSYSYGEDFQYEHHWDWSKYENELKQGVIPLRTGFELSDKEQSIAKLMWLLKTGRTFNIEKGEASILKPLLKRKLLQKEQQKITITEPAKAITEWMISKIIRQNASKK